MGAVAIEINDSGLVVANDAGVLAIEPGFARVDGGRIVTGEQARARARLNPRQTSSRFWSALSMDPGSAGSDIRKSAAELAYAQLESLWQRFGAGVTAVVLVVPGGYRTEQLGLLLGLAQECGMPVRALVDAAAAASVRPYPKRQLVYVDASLYRVSVSLLAQNGEVQVRAEHALAQGLVRRRRCVRAPHRGSFRARDALRSVHARRGGAGAVRPLARRGSRRCSARSASSCR